ncbi:MAG: UPF0175 family protein [Opitutales bacterium]|nr:UPF0175 family protein [Opitutales bacterium]
MKIELEVPDNLLAEWGSKPDSVRDRLQLELALHLYASRKVSAGSAAEIAGISRGTFEEALKASGIERSYSMADLESDLAWVGGATDGSRA